MNKKQFTYPYGIWIVGFTVIPLLILLYYAFTKDGSLTFTNFSQIPLKPFYTAILYSLITTVICLLLAYPLSLILAGMNFKNSNTVIFIFILPMWMNFLLRTMAWQTLLERNGVINSILGIIGLGPYKLINTGGAILIALIYNYLPFMILPIYNSLTKIDKDVIDASADLGATKTQTFFRIILPLTKPGIISAITMVFVPVLTTFAISDILGGAKIPLIGNIIEQLFKQDSTSNTGSAISFILMIFVLLSMTLLKKYESDEV